MGFILLLLYFDVVMQTIYNLGEVFYYTEWLKQIFGLYQKARLPLTIYMEDKRKIKPNLKNKSATTLPKFRDIIVSTCV